MRAYQTRRGGRHVAIQRGLQTSLAVQHGGERAGAMTSIRKNNVGYGLQGQKTVEGSIPRQPIQNPPAA